MYTVISNNNKHCQIDIQAFQKHSQVIQNLSDCKPSQEPFHIQVRDDILLILNEYLVSVKNVELKPVPKPIPNHRLDTFLNEIDAKFVNGLNDGDRLLILKAAEYLKIDHVEALCFAWMATQFIGKTTQEFIQVYGLNVTYTPELEQEIQSRYQQHYQLGQ